MIANRLTFLLAGALALMPAASASSRADEPQKIASVNDLWRGFDPEALPLELEVTRTWEEQGIVFQRLRFTGELAQAGKVRVFAICGAPKIGRMLPGILHVHGGGQTASLDWVRYWTQRGYVCVSFDFCGPWAQRTEVTEWGPIKQGNMAQANGGFQLRPTPRESSWYHWVLVSRRALTLLARQPQVDPQRLGIFGISVGGSLTWMIAGTDRRVKTAVAIYGCGYNYDRRNASWGLVTPSDDLNLFQRLLAPEAYAPYVSCPLLFLSGTNDFHGLMDRAYDALGAATGPVYQAFSPRTDHHIEPREGRDLALWMDWQLKDAAAWPKTPPLKVTLDRQGIPEAVVTLDSPDTVSSVDVYYYLGDKRPQVRFWRSAIAEQQAGRYRAALPVMDTWDDLRAFANVTYKSGVCLSTSLHHVIPAQLGKARATLSSQAALEAWTNGLDGWKFLGAFTDPSMDWEYLRTNRDAQLGPLLSFNTERLGDPVPVQLSTCILGDPQFQGREGLALAFQVQGDFIGEGLTLTLIEQDKSLQARSYSVNITKNDLTPGWREVVLPLSRFTDKDKRTPRGWQDIDKLEIRGKASRQNPPRFARFRWLNPIAVPKPAAADPKSHP